MDMRSPRQLSDGEVQALNDQASALVRRGLEILDDGAAQTAERALACFDRAVALRLQLPLERSPWLQFDLGGALLNRADVLLGLGGDIRLHLALQTYAAAVTWLEDLPLELDVKFPARLAVAYHNRGVALRARGAASLGASLQDFAAAITLLESLDDDGAGADRRRYLATAWVGLADARAASASPDASRQAIAAAHRAVLVLGDLEQHDEAAAAVGLRARHVCCRAAAGCLMVDLAAPAAPTDDVHAATDAVDDGLALMRQWERRGTTAFRALGCDLFRFGLRIYARYQPQFLEEFVREHVDGADGVLGYMAAPDMVEAVAEARRMTPKETT
jgi:hypothetical protein